MSFNRNGNIEKNHINNNDLSSYKEVRAFYRNSCHRSQRLWLKMELRSIFPFYTNKAIRRGFERQVWHFRLLRFKTTFVVTQLHKFPRQFITIKILIVINISLSTFFGVFPIHKLKKNQNWLPDSGNQLTLKCSIG